MKTRTLLMVVAAGLFLVVAPAEAQKEKKPSLPPGDLFFTMKGQPFAMERTFPGVVGALLLTDEQKLKLHAALDETVRSEAVQSAGKTVKTDPNATEAQKEEARKLIQEARAKLQQQVAGILTQEQKTLVERLNTAAVEAHQVAREKLEAEFIAAKGDKPKTEEVQKKVREEAVAEFSRKLVGLLTAEQRQGLEKAAEQQKKAEEAAGKKIKSK
jgi:Spy/CpxP family protein refolding chaperone